MTDVDAGRATNLALLTRMVALLGDFAESLVFVGGTATGLLVTAVRAQAVRVTTDVDVVVNVATIREYQKVEAQLAERGFVRDESPDAPICRWRCEGLQLDVLPSQPGVLGFHNRWYPLAVATAVPYDLPAGRSIQLVTAPLFIATKLEAFLDRGHGDYVASHDLEDIVTIIDGRAEVMLEAQAAPEAVRDCLRERISGLLADDAFVTALQGHLPGDAASQSRVPELLERLRMLASVG